MVMFFMSGSDTEFQPGHSPRWAVVGVEPMGLLRGGRCAMPDHRALELHGWPRPWTPGPSGLGMPAGWGGRMSSPS